MLNEFYAVTMTSVYHVMEKGSWHASAIKICLEGRSRLPVGADLAEGGMIAIRDHIRGYIPEGGRVLENVNTVHWRDGSSPIVALFLDKKSALECFEHSGRAPCDRRWLDDTKKVLDAIGDDHPSFYISKDPRFSLIPPAKGPATAA